MKKIDWYRVLDILAVPLAFAVIYGAIDIGQILAIRYGWESQRQLLFLGWLIGSLGGYLYCWICVDRFRKKEINAMRKLIDTYRSLVPIYEAEIDRLKEARHQEGEGWKEEN